MSTTPAPTQPIAMILGVVQAAADAAITATEAVVPPLTDEMVTMFNKVVMPHLNVPQFLVPLILGSESKVTTPLDKFAIAELELLRLRIGALV